MPDDQEQIQEIQNVTEQNPEVLEQPQEQIEEASVEEKSHQKKKDAEYNFAELRRQREEDKRRADEAERRFIESEKRNRELLQLFTEKSAAKNATHRDPEDDEVDRLAQDDLPTVKHVDKKISKKTQALQQQVEQLKSQLEEMRFHSKYQDFNDIVTDDNIRLLREREPELANALNALPTGSYDQAVAAYKYIKMAFPKQQIQQEDPIEKKKALENMKKPMSVNSIPKGSAISNAFRWEREAPSQELKNNVWKEMQEAMKKG